MPACAARPACATRATSLGSYPVPLSPLEILIRHAPAPAPLPSRPGLPPQPHVRQDPPYLGYRNTLGPDLLFSCPFRIACCTSVVVTTKGPSRASPADTSVAVAGSPELVALVALVAHSHNASIVNDKGRLPPTRPARPGRPGSMPPSARANPQSVSFRSAAFR
jgi:hypothetical protein